MKRILAVAAAVAAAQSSAIAGGTRRSLTRIEEAKVGRARSSAERAVEKRPAPLPAGAKAAAGRATLNAERARALGSRSAMSPEASIRYWNEVVLLSKPPGDKLDLNDDGVLKLIEQFPRRFESNWLFDAHPKTQLAVARVIARAGELWGPRAMEVTEKELGRVPWSDTREAAEVLLRLAKAYELEPSKIEFLVGVSLADYASLRASGESRKKTPPESRKTERALPEHAFEAAATPEPRAHYSGEKPPAPGEVKWEPIRRSGVPKAEEKPARAQNPAQVTITPIAGAEPAGPISKGTGLPTDGHWRYLLETQPPEALAINDDMVRDYAKGLGVWRTNAVEEILHDFASVRIPYLRIAARAAELGTPFPVMNEAMLNRITWPAEAGPLILRVAMAYRLEPSKIEIAGTSLEVLTKRQKSAQATETGSKQSIIYDQGKLPREAAAPLGTGSPPIGGYSAVVKRLRNGGEIQPGELALDDEGVIDWFRVANRDGQDRSDFGSYDGIIFKIVPYFNRDYFASLSATGKIAVLRLFARYAELGHSAGGLGDLLSDLDVNLQVPPSEEGAAVLSRLLKAAGYTGRFTRFAGAPFSALERDNIEAFVRDVANEHRSVPSLRIEDLQFWASRLPVSTANAENLKKIATRYGFNQ